MTDESGARERVVLPDGTVVKIGGTLTIHADRVVLAEDKPAREMLARYRRNALLLSLLTLIVGLWFYRHLQSVVAQFLIGIPALWAAWQVAWSTAGKDLGDDMKAMRKRLIADERTTTVLAGAYVLAAIALLFTASFFVELGSGDVKEVTVHVVDASSMRILPPIKLDSTHPTGGRIFFPRLFTDELRLIATDPDDWAPRDRAPISFRPMSAHRLSVAKDFEKKSHRVLVIVPGLSLRDPLANSPDAVLTVARRGRRTIEVPSYVESTVVTGIASPAKLATVFNGFDQREFSPWLIRELAVSGVGAQNLMASVATARVPRYVDHQKLREGEVVTIRLRGAEVNGVCHKVTMDSEVTAVILEATSTCRSDSLSPR